MSCINNILLWYKKEKQLQIDWIIVILLTEKKMKSVGSLYKLLVIAQENESVNYICLIFRGIGN